MTKTLAVLDAPVENASTTNANAPRGKMKRSTMTRTITQLMKMQKKIRFDLAIQRKTVWSETQKSMLIHSILDEYPIPLLFISATDDGYFWMLDGKQRLTSIFGFVNGEFPLTKDTPAVYIEKEVEVDGAHHTLCELVEVEGKFFKDLDEELQKQIMDYSMTIVEMKNITPSQSEELFQRLNGGSPLTQMELTRALSGSATMVFLQELAENKFFSEFASISDKARDRYVDQELIMQILMLVMGRESGISSKEIKEFAQDLRSIGIDDETKASMIATTEYLQSAFEVLNEDAKKNKTLQNKILKKIHIPMLFLTAQVGMKHNITTEQFAEFAIEFLVKNYSSGSGVYGSQCVSGSAKVKAVNIRKTHMREVFCKKFGIVEVAPVATETEIKEEFKDEDENGGGGGAVQPDSETAENPSTEGEADTGEATEPAPQPDADSSDTQEDKGSQE